MSLIRYTYATIPAAGIYPLTDAQARSEAGIKLGGSFIADDSDARALAALTDAGYRWVRTDSSSAAGPDGVAVFERAEFDPKATPPEVVSRIRAIRDLARNESTTRQQLRDSLNVLLGDLVARSGRASLATPSPEPT